MSSRRTFIQQIAGGAAALAAPGTFPTSKILGANFAVYNHSKPKEEFLRYV